MARAFTRNQASAVFTYPTCLVSLLPYVLRRGLYASRDGMVVFCRYRPWLDILLALLMALLLSAATVLTFGVVYYFLGMAGLIAIGIVAAAALWGACLLVGAASFTRAVGPETPSGKRWMVASLAQRPGTKLSALLLARRKARSLAAGAVIVAVAADGHLARSYARLGFTPGARTRVYRVM
jgi:hypothetical protein